MNTKRITLLVMAAMVLWIPAVSQAGAAPAGLAKEAAAPQSLESIEKAIIEKWDALSAMSAAFDINVEVKLNPDMPNPMKLTGVGSADYRKKADKKCYRIDAWAGFSAASKMAQYQEVCDGTNVYRDIFVPLLQIRETGAANPSEVVSPDPKKLLELAGEHLNLAAAASEKVADQDCYVVEGAPKEQDAKNPVAKVKICFAKATGVPLLIAAMDKAGIQIGSIALKDVKVNHELADSVFQYVPLVLPAPPAPPAPAEPAKTPEAAKPAAVEKK